MSSASNATDTGFHAKGKRRALEVQGAITTGIDDSCVIIAGKKVRKRLRSEQKFEVLQFLKKVTKHAEIAQRHACNERVMSSVANKGRFELKMKPPDFSGKATTEMVSSSLQQTTSSRHFRRIGCSVIDELPNVVGSVQGQYHVR